MAKNAKYYAKISGTWEQQYFQSTAAQITYPNQGSGLLNGKTTVDAALDEIHNKFGAAGGFATLDGTSKLTASQLPASVIGGMKFVTTIDLSTSRSGDYLASQGMTEVGDYMIVTNAGQLTNSGSTIQVSVRAPGDEDGNNIGTMTLEAGDWIVLSAIGTNAYTLAIVNNTYQDATTASKGIVQLSNYADGDGFSTLAGNGVVTEGVLKTSIEDNFGTGATNFAAGNHNHNSTYLALSGGTLTGALSTAQVTVGTGDSGSDLILNPVDDDAAVGSNSNSIQFKHLASGGSVATTALLANTAGNLKYGSNFVLHNNNWDTYVPEIFVSTSTPSGGKNGDVWIEYTA